MIPASIRNNNPGAMEPGPSSKRFGATAHEVLRWRNPTTGMVHTNRIATFPTAVHGAAAQFHLLRTGRHYRNKPIRQAIATWCGGYSAKTYEGVLKRRAGVGPETLLTEELVADPELAIPLAKAMAWQEAGREFPLDDDGWARAHEMAHGDGCAPAPSPDNDVPAQKPGDRLRDKLQTARQVATAVVGVGGGGVAVGVSQTPPAGSSDVAKAIAKGQEIQTQVEAARDIGVWAKGFGAWVMTGEGALVSIVMALAAGVVLVLPKFTGRAG